MHVPCDPSRGCAHPHPRSHDRAAGDAALPLRQVAARARVSVPPSPFRLSLVQNVSTQGLGLLLTQALPQDTLLEIEINRATAATRVARVVHATKVDGGWLIGCALNH